MQDCDRACASRGETQALDEASETLVAAQRRVDRTHSQPGELRRTLHCRFIQAVERGFMVAQAEEYLRLVYGRDVGRRRTRGQLGERPLGPGAISRKRMGDAECGDAFAGVPE